MHAKEQLKAILVKIHENDWLDIYMKITYYKYFYFDIYVLYKVYLVNYYTMLPKHRNIFNKFNGDLDRNYHLISSIHEA